MSSELNVSSPIEAILAHRSVCLKRVLTLREEKVPFWLIRKSDHGGIVL